MTINFKYFLFHSVEILDERERTRTTSYGDSNFRFPGGDKTVQFSVRSMPKLNAATAVEDWLPKEYKVLY